MFFTKKISFYSVLFLLSLSATAQPLVKAEADKTAIVIGDEVIVGVYIKNATNPKLPNLQNDTLPLEILSQTNPVQKGDEWLAILSLTAFDSGTYTMPPIPVTVDEKGTIVYSNTITIQVSYPIGSGVDTARLAPLLPILEEGRTWEDYAPYIYGLLVLVVLSVVAYSVYRYLKKPLPLPPLPMETPKTPREIALEKLAVLEVSALWQKGEIKHYYTELTFIVREFIEKQYHIPALENTTSELYDNLKNADFPAQDAKRVFEWLENADLVKFAKMTPPNEVHQKAMEWAKEYLGF